MDTEILTYRELADRLGVKLDSARKTVQRRRWKRVTGNDNVVRVHVPIDYLSRPADSPKDNTRELEIMIENLKALVEAEKRRADEAVKDRDRWHEYAVRPWWKRLAG